jgi:hypothetical protein
MLEAVIHWESLGAKEFTWDFLCQISNDSDLDWFGIFGFALRYLLIFTFGHVRPHMVTWSHHLVSSCCWFDNVCFIQSDDVLNGCLRTLRRSLNLWSPTGTISRTVDLIRLQFQRMYHIHLRRTSQTKPSSLHGWRIWCTVGSFFDGQASLVSSYLYWSLVVNMNILYFRIITCRIESKRIGGQSWSITNNLVVYHNFPIRMAINGRIPFSETPIRTQTFPAGFASSTKVPGIFGAWAGGWSGLHSGCSCMAAVGAIKVGTQALSLTFKHMHTW